MGLRPLYAGTIRGSAPFIRRDDTWVCALYTQGRYMGLYPLYAGMIMGLRPSYAGMIHGSAPFIRRVAGQGLFVWVCAHIHRDLARDYIYIFIDVYTYIYVCT